MAYEILEHTADMRMRVVGRTLEELFREAVLGMMAIFDPQGGENASHHRLKSRKIVVDAHDPTALLIDFLNEVLLLTQTYKESYDEVEFENFSPTSIEAILRGRPVEAFARDIKAVTYHEAEVRKNGAGEWETMLVFDI